MEITNQHDFIEFRRKDTQGYSKGITKILNLAESYVTDAEKAALSGKNVIWGNDLEAVIAYACDTITVSHTELGRLASPEALQVAENHFQSPKDICTMVGVILGEWYLRRHKINRLVAISSMCEAFNMSWELLKNEGFDVHRVEMTFPGTYVSEELTEKRLGLFIDEIYSLGRWINHGKELDETKLAKQMEFENNIHSKIQRILELRAKNPYFMKSLETLYMLIGSTHFFGKPQEYAETINILLEELEKDEYHPDASKVIPLVWTGGRGQEFSIYHTIDEYGGAILGWNIPTTYETMYDLSLPPVESLARCKFYQHHSGPLMDRVQFTKREVDRFNAKGVLIYHYVGCSLGGVSKEMTRNYFHEIGIPSLAFDGNFDVGAPSGQLITRVKAFMEMLS